MSKIIVTGGLGFIGSHFINYVNENQDDEIILIDKITYAANPNNIRKSVKFLQKDICDVTSEELGEYDYIVNFAAESHVDNSISNGLPFVRTNVEGTFNLIEVARKNKNLKKFIQISTDEVYGDMDDYPGYKIANEESPLIGSSYYSATKLSSDMLVMAAGRTYKLPYLITRTCNNYGENQHKEKFVPKIINSIKNGIEVPVYGDGNQIREWIHADDNAKAIYKLLKSDYVNKIFNIGTGERYTNNEIVSMISESLGKDVKFKYVEDRLGHDRRYSLDSGKYMNIFGDIQNITFKEWIKETINKIKNK
jgi:dTDP-glucose 4,6-dehydratase